MPELIDIKKYYRFCMGMRKYLRHTISLNESRQIIKRQFKKREELFLRIVEKGVYGNPKSPYLKLLNSAGWEFGDIKSSTKSIGIEHTLEKLVRDGVYVNFEEFKGRKKAVRNEVALDFRESDFDNPFLSRHFDVESGGSGGLGTRTMIDFDFLSYEAAHRALVLDTYGLMDSPSIIWFPILPGSAGTTNILRQVKIGRPCLKWFSQVDKRSIRPPIKDRFGTGFIVFSGGLFGRKIPNPKHVDLKDAHKIAIYISSIMKDRSKCCVWSYVSSAIRICIAAKDKNLDFTGVTFFVSGEPLTKTKSEEIKSSGAVAVPYFAFAEGGIIAHGCANPGETDDMHILRDRVAVISHKIRPRYFHKTVDALLFTSLIPESPKILLNVETGDHGLIDSRECGCRFEGYGFSDHISSIRSFEKATSEGMTLMVSDLIRIVEDVLPAKHGGGSTDYQALEEYDGAGLSFINIAVSPRVGPVDDADLKQTIIQALGKGGGSKRLMARILSDAEAIKIKRMDPIPTMRGKLLPFRNLNG